MSRIEDHGPVQIEYDLPNKVVIKIDFYALSLAAMRIIDGHRYEFGHEASYAPRPIDSIEEAFAHGMKEAEVKWPSSKGWQHDVKVQAVTVNNEFPIPPLTRNQG